MASRVTDELSEPEVERAIPLNESSEEARRGDDVAFGRPFWLTYVANCSMMVAISLLFRYADFVKSLGGDELNVGWIVGVGMVGSLAMRLAQGVGIDRYGPRAVWLVSSVMFIAGCLAHLLVTRLDTPFIFLARITYQTAIAGFFGASITYISGKAPVARMAEVIGSLGTSGFLGMVVGPALGDALLGGGKVTRPMIDRMFLCAAGIAALGFVASWFATRGHPPPARKSGPKPWSVVRRHQPGALLLVGVAMGFGLGLPGNFLSPFAQELRVDRIAFFFWIYAPMAFTTRVALRRFPDRVGIRPMILIGVAFLVSSMLSFLWVREAWHFALPALLMAVSHAMLFPSVVAGGSGEFPVEYRGLGTTLVLSMIDLGSLIGPPTVGRIVEYSREHDLAPYPTMFVIVAGILGLLGAIYAFSSRGETTEPEGGASADDRSETVEIRNA